MIKLYSTELILIILKSQINLLLLVIKSNPEARKVKLIAASMTLIKLQIVGRVNKIILSESHL
jgi:hypothetical protein